MLSFVIKISFGYGPIVQITLKGLEVVGDPLVAADDEVPFPFSLGRLRPMRQTSSM
jgi:hypothetical protein